MYRKKVFVSRPRRESVPCRSMREQLEAVEQFGAELGEKAPEESYMFHSEDEIDMDAFHDRFLDKQRIGASTDAASYFEELSSRFGFACRAENSPTSTPSATPPATPPATSPATSTST